MAVRVAGIQRRKGRISGNIVTGVGGNNGSVPLSVAASVNAPQMGDKRRRPILRTKRETGPRGEKKRRRRRKKRDGKGNRYGEVRKSSSKSAGRDDEGIPRSWKDRLESFFATRAGCWEFFLDFEHGFLTPVYDRPLNFHRNSIGSIRTFRS